MSSSRRALDLVHVGSSPRLELPDDEWKQVLETRVTTIARTGKAVPALLVLTVTDQRLKRSAGRCRAEITVRLRRHLIRMFLAGQGVPANEWHFTGPGRRSPPAEILIAASSLSASGAPERGHRLACGRLRCLRRSMAT